MRPNYYRPSSERSNIVDMQCFPQIVQLHDVFGDYLLSHVNFQAFYLKAFPYY